MITLSINNIPVEVPEETRLLGAAHKAGVRIPTLCHVEGLQTIGACRVCVVEVEGAQNLVASCAMPAAAGMKVFTNTRRVRKARQAVVELLLSEHNGECQTCDRSEDCELQALAAELGIREIEYHGEKIRKRIDDSTPALIRDNGKCIKCRRCVSVYPRSRTSAPCSRKTAASKPSSAPPSIRPQRGGLRPVRPVRGDLPRRAITETRPDRRGLDRPGDPRQTHHRADGPGDPRRPGRVFRLSAGHARDGQDGRGAAAAGFPGRVRHQFRRRSDDHRRGHRVALAASQGAGRKQPVALPMFTSCSPGWIKFLEYFHPDMLPNLSTCKSPQQMFGAVAKTYYAEKLGKRPEDIFVVSVMPCTAKKFECQRPEMTASGVRDVDVVLTTRELGKMIHAAGIDFARLPDEEMDAPLGLSSGAADIFANTGGVMEAALRTAYEIVTGRELPSPNLHVAPVAGLAGVKEASLKIEGTLPDWLPGRRHAQRGRGPRAGQRPAGDRPIKSGEKQYHFVEVMTCPGGCIGGGGQPRFTDNSVREARIAAIYREDEGKGLRKSHENPDVARLYAEFLGKPLGERSHHLLHTTYTPRERV